MRLDTETEVRQEVVTLLPGDVLGTAELARELGIRPRTLSAYLARGQVPAPALQLACGPLWTRAQVTELLERYAARAARAEKRLRAAEKAWTGAVKEMAESMSHDYSDTEKRRRHEQRGRYKRQQAGVRRDGKRSGASGAKVQRLPDTVVQETRKRAASDLEADPILAAERDEAERLQTELDRRRDNMLRGTADDWMLDTGYDETRYVTPFYVKPVIS